MLQNKFLQDFVKRQNEIQIIETADKSVKKDKKGNRKSRHGTASGEHPFGEDDAFMTLVKEKPGKKEVLEYFRAKIGELVAEDMK